MAHNYGEIKHVYCFHYLTNLLEVLYLIISSGTLTMTTSRYLALQWIGVIRKIQEYENRDVAF